MLVLQRNEVDKKLLKEVARTIWASASECSLDRLMCAAKGVEIALNEGER